MIPSIPPKCLTVLSTIEEMLIAKSIPVIKIYSSYKTGSRVSGNCLNINNDISKIVNILPRKVSSLRISLDSEFTKKSYEFKINRNNILTALTFKKK